MKTCYKRSCKNLLAISVGTTLASFPSIGLTAVQGGLEEIVVTARKRSESLQDISAAVSAVSADTLKEKVINDVKDLQSLVPSLNVGEVIGIMKLNMRGLSNSTTVRGEDSEVVLHVDGAVVSRAEAQGTAFFDLERIEVLRGPQGTLYGRNSTGGTVNLITAKPTEEFSGYINGTLGNYDLVKVETAVSGPLSEKILGRVAFQNIDRSGYSDNLATGKDFNDEKRWAARAHLQFNFTDDVSFLLSGEFTDQDDSSGHLTYLDTLFGTPHTVIPPQFFSDPKSRDGALSTQPQMKKETSSITGTLDWRINDELSLRSISNYRDLEFFNWSDLDVSAYPYVDVGLPLKDEQVSQEIQLIYDRENLHAMAGLYYYKETFDGTTDVYLRYANSALFQFVGETETEALSPFWNASYDLNDKFTLRIGGRLNREDREFTNASFFRGNPVASLTDDKSFSEYTGEYGVDYHLNEGTLLYYTYSQGFRSGASLIMQVDSPIIDPTTVDNHEIGVKFTSEDQRFLANVAAFSAKISDLQRGQAVAVLDANGNSIGSALRVNNINDMATEGVEIELNWSPVDPLRVNGTVIYINGEFKDFITDDPTIPGTNFIQVAGNTPQLTPDWRWNLGAEYDIDLAENGMLTASANYSYVGKQYFDEFNRAPFEEEAYGLLDAGLTYRPTSDQWSLTLWGKNLADEDKIYDTNISVLGQIKNKLIITPRTFGLSANYSF